MARRQSSEKQEEVLTRPTSILDLREIDWCCFKPPGLSHFITAAQAKTVGFPKEVGLQLRSPVGNKGGK
jgi:hypothetical protein